MFELSLLFPQTSISRRPDGFLRGSQSDHPCRTVGSRCPHRVCDHPQEVDAARSGFFRCSSQTSENLADMTRLIHSVPSTVTKCWFFADNISILFTITEPVLQWIAAQCGKWVSLGMKMQMIWHRPQVESSGSHTHLRAKRDAHKKPRKWCVEHKIPVQYLHPISSNKASTNRPGSSHSNYCELEASGVARGCWGAGTSRARCFYLVGSEHNFSSDRGN